MLVARPRDHYSNAWNLQWHHWCLLQWLIMPERVLTPVRACMAQSFSCYCTIVELLGLPTKHALPASCDYFRVVVVYIQRVCMGPKKSDSSQPWKVLSAVKSHWFKSKCIAIPEVAVQAPAIEGTATSSPNAHCLPLLKFSDSQRHLCNFDLRRPVTRSHSSTWLPLFS